MPDAFRIVFILGDRAVDAVQDSDVPPEIKADLLAARKYLEGRGFQIEVARKEDNGIILQLVDIKMNH